MADDSGVAGALGHLDGGKSLAQGANLVDLDQDRVGNALLNTFLEDLGVERLDSLAPQAGSSAGKRVKVFVNGNWFGLSADADDLIASVLRLRRSLEIPKEIAIVRDI